MNPPREFYSADGETVTLLRIWVVAVAGVERFELGRHDLRDDSDLVAQGVAMGLDARILEWMKGGPEALVLEKGVFE